MERDRLRNRLDIEARLTGHNLGTLEVGNAAIVTRAEEAHSHVESEPTLSARRPYQALPPRTTTGNIIEPRAEFPRWTNIKISRINARRFGRGDKGARTIRAKRRLNV